MAAARCGDGDRRRLPLAAQRVGRAAVQLGLGQRLAQSFVFALRRGADRAGSEVAFHLRALGGVELVVEIGVQQARLIAGHGGAPPSVDA